MSLPRRALAGCHDPRIPPGERERVELVEALRGDGDAEAIADGPLAVAATGTGHEPGYRSGVLCRLDGRITNRSALAAELDLPADIDPEVLLAAGFARWDHGLPERLRGEFAFLVWNREARRGLLACDRLGHHGLFLHRSGARTLFASEPRNLLALLPRRPDPDPVAVDAWLARGGLRGGRTLYAGIQRLEGGWLLSLDQGDTEPRSYWAPRYVPPARMSWSECVERVREGMQGAVARALPEDGDGSCGVLLSGGFDSGAVAALAGRARPRAYSVTFPDHPEVDESRRIGTVRSTLGLDVVEEPFSGGSALAAALDFQATWEVPSIAPNWFVWKPLVRRAAADGVRVLLDGEGGDEVFGCAPYLMADRLRAGRALSALALARAVPGMGDRPAPRLLRRALVRYGVRGALPPGLHEALRRRRAAARHAPPWLQPEDARRWREHDERWEWKRLDGPRWWASLADVLTDAASALGAPDQLRREGTLGGAAFRHPFRDSELVELALALPPEMAFDAQLDRPVARAAMQGLLPDEVRLNDDKPHFNRVLEGALAGPDWASVKELLGDPRAAVGEHVRLEAVRSALLDGQPGSRRRRLTWSLDLWRLVTLESWLRHQADPAWTEAYGSGLTANLIAR
jgi:asparagine synthase (glutamine-hydrolysing)